MKITQCTAKEIIDSRGMPTVEVQMGAGEVVVRAAVPSGKSTGSREALELRDADGRGVSRAVANVNDVIAREIMGHNLAPNEIDRVLLDLDGTDNKSNLGANAMLGVSIVATKLAARVAGMPVWRYIADANGADPRLPKLFMNVLNGGTHADFRLPFQEYMIVTQDELVSSALTKAEHILHALGDRLGEVPMGDEGGYSPTFGTIEAPFDLLREIAGDSTPLAIDVAATEFFSDGTYNVLGEKYSKTELLDIYKDLVDTHALASIEDPFEESDVQGFAQLLSEVGANTLVVGDDLTVTNPAIITRMIEQKVANAVIIKPNQIGTLSEAYEAVTLAHTDGWRVIASHRSGETLDPFIADFAVGVGAYGIKAGSPLQKERKVKYDRLLAIEKELIK